ncbi:unnamed protein product [Prunus armeniaca]|uniref:Uncharacterized protein n=1 Tax=Prunus armeniaca TaxID=36596 RepID=A0A6J5X8M5_PRUAR|nr:unnamed protein product [Prunus armeniaca]CAB4308322.1 unnamed protein product [Prunus armeniaca]
MVDSENVVKENTEDLWKATEPEAEVVHEPAVGENKTNAGETENEDITKIRKGKCRSKYGRCQTYRLTYQHLRDKDGNSKTPENVMKDLGGEESQTHLPFEDWKCRTSVSTGHSTTIRPNTGRVNSGRDFHANKGHIILRYV